MSKDNTPPPTSVMKLDDKGVYIVRDQADEYRVATNLLRTGAAPASFKTPEQVMVALQALKSMGLNPVTGLRQTGFINGAFTLYGDLPLARVRQSKDLESFEEFAYVKTDGKNVRQSFENNNEDQETFGYICRIKRRGMPLKEVCFSQAHAKRAGLWRPPSAQSPWNKYPDKMLKYRARSEAIKDVFGDFLSGVAIGEYDDLSGAAPVASTSVPINRPERGVSPSEAERLAEFVEARIADEDAASAAPASAEGVEPAAAQTPAASPTPASRNAGEMPWAKHLPSNND